MKGGIEMQRSVLVFDEKAHRIRIKNQLKSLGVKVRHDSGALDLPPENRAF